MNPAVYHLTLYDYDRPVLLDALAAYSKAMTERGGPEAVAAAAIAEVLYERAARL